jgi:hypothetical protein
MSKKITAADTVTEQADKRDVTGTTNTAETKRSLDTVINNEAGSPIPITNEDGLLAGVTYDYNEDGLLAGVTYDYIARTTPSSTVERYTYRDGGSGGTIVAVIDVTYTDATLEVLLSVERTT